MCPPPSILGWSSRSSEHTVIALRLIPVVLSLLLLGAHSMRAGTPALLPVVAGMLILLMVRRPWAARLVQLALLLGSLEWLHTLRQLHAVRTLLGQPTTRLVVILAVVAAWTLLSALLFETGPMRRRYGLSRERR